MQVLYNALITPDGTELVSRHRHDFQSHTDANGKWYMIDGGLSYSRGSYDSDATRILLTDEDPHSLIREHFEWGTYGPDGDQPISYLKLKDVTIDHLQNILKDVGMPDFIRKVIQDELDWKTNDKNK